MLRTVCGKPPLKRALIVPLLLTGCATANFECPIPKDYSVHQQAKLAFELEKMKPNSTAAQFIADYGVLRNEARACAMSSFVSSQQH